MNHLDLLSIGDVSIDQYLTISEAEIVGNANTDQAKICFGYGSKIPVDKFSATIAGNACNNAIACNKLGLHTAVYTELGDDPNGNKFIEVFDKVGIDSKFCVKNKDQATNVNSIIIYKGERTIFSSHAARNYKIHNWPQPKWIYYTSMPPKSEKFQHELIEYLKDKGIGLAFNPGTYQLRSGIASLKNILELTNVLFLNETEAQMLVGKLPLMELHKNLRELGPAVTVITQGKAGSSAYDGQDFEQLGIWDEKYEVVDKTGAGDAHSAGFLAGMFYGKKLRECLMWGTLNAAHVMQKAGSVHGHLKKAEIEDLIRRHPKFK